jgi:hypothetical protein
MLLKAFKKYLVDTLTPFFGVILRKPVEVSIDLCGGVISGHGAADSPPKILLHIVMNLLIRGALRPAAADILHRAEMAEGVRRQASEFLASQTNTFKE